MHLPVLLCWPTLKLVSDEPRWNGYSPLDCDFTRLAMNTNSMDFNAMDANPMGLMLDLERQPESAIHWLAMYVYGLRLNLGQWPPWLMLRGSKMHKRKYRSESSFVNRSTVPLSLENSQNHSFWMSTKFNYTKFASNFVQKSSYN